MRLFVAALLSPEAVEDLEAFLDPRRSAPEAPRWADPYQWHLTLSFMGSVPARRVDGLVERLSARSSRWSPLTLQVRGGGAFPHVGSAKVLYAGLTAVQDASVPTRGPVAEGGADGREALAALARSVRHACSAVGCDPHGSRFRPHVTLGRFRPPVEATRWVRLLDTYAGPPFRLTEIALVESHPGLGAGGHPRHDLVERFPLAESSPSVPE